MPNGKSGVLLQPPPGKKFGSIVLISIIETHVFKALGNDTEWRD